MVIDPCLYKYIPTNYILNYSQLFVESFPWWWEIWGCMESPLSPLPFHPDWVMATVALQDAELDQAMVCTRTARTGWISENNSSSLHSSAATVQRNGIWYEYDMNMNWIWYGIWNGFWKLKIIICRFQEHLLLLAHTVAQMILARQARRAVSHCMIVLYGFSTFQVVWCDTDI